LEREGAREGIKEGLLKAKVPMFGHLLVLGGPFRFYFFKSSSRGLLDYPYLTLDTFGDHPWGRVNPDPS